jgi:(2Fe-2S) ferredoxin
MSEHVPHFSRHVFFCCNRRDEADRTSCERHGASALRDHCKQRVKQLGLAGKGRVRVNQAGCLDRCEEGPVAVVYPEAVWYRYETRADIDEIVESHLRDGVPVQRLRL